MTILSVTLAVSLAVLPPPPVAPTGSPLAHAVPDRWATPLERAAFQDAMRKLWEDHVTWTRLYIVSAVAGLPDAQPAAQRLLQNQADIGNAIRPFYGEVAGDKLSDLLRSHILIAADLVTAAKVGNAADVQTAAARWDANAVEIADFLSGANPVSWPRATMRTEMRHHLELTLREAQARLQGDWAADIVAYDEIHTHILGLADLLTAGIIKQFPKQFGR